MKLKVLEDRIVIKRIPEREETRGGIVIPQMNREKQTEADVLHVGPGHRLESGATVPMTVKVGDRVMLGKYAGTDIILDDEPLVIIRESDVLAILYDEKESKAKTISLREL